MLPAVTTVPYRISLVCLGNICRSPMAESVLRTHVAAAGLAEHVVVDSAGTGAWHLGERADSRARAALARRGYDGEAHRARQFTADWFDTVDLVLALDHDNARALRALAPDDSARDRVRLLRSFDPTVTEVADQAVPDPYYGTAADFDDGLALIERASVGVVDALARHLADAGVTGG